MRRLNRFNLYYRGSDGSKVTSMDKIEIRYVTTDIEALSVEDRELAAKALKACDTSYAPYSGFKVGAAVRLDDGSILTSSNQESEVLPEGICAERGLLYYVQANDNGRKITAMAIASVSTDKTCFPCGACRQIIAEAAKRQGVPFRLIMCGADTATIVEDPKELLPFTFELQ